MDLIFKEEAANARYKPTKEAQQCDDELRDLLGFDKRYEAARLSIGRSLAEVDPPPPLPSGVERGTEIQGRTLLGDEIDLWLAALIIEGKMGPEATPAHLRTALEAHWARGAMLLRSEIQASDRNDMAFLRRLADLLPNTAGSSQTPDMPTSDIHRIEVAAGPVSRSIEKDEPVSVALNDAGVSPHIALMGRTRSGKTRTGLRMALDICEEAQVPLLFIDPKGEFVQDGELHAWPENHGPRPAAIDVGRQPIPLDFLPNPSAGQTDVARAAYRFRDSIARCCRQFGDVQRDQLGAAIVEAVQHSDRRDLRAVRDAYQEQLQQTGRDSDSVLSRLNDVSAAFTVFEPRLKPAEFLQRSWVIGLKQLPGDDLRRLVMLLLLDALAGQITAQPDAPHQNGYRQLRHVLVIDEARRILSESKSESLSDLVREGASKGQVVMLLSQDPSDFVGQVDDFTTQLQTIIAFACAQSQRGLKALAGAYGRKLQPQEFSDTRLDKGVAFAKLPNRSAERVRAWAPDE